jgi:hypothetical protein
MTQILRVWIGLPGMMSKSELEQTLSYFYSRTGYHLPRMEPRLLSHLQLWPFWACCRALKVRDDENYPEHVGTFVRAGSWPSPSKLFEQTFEMT